MVVSLLFQALMTFYLRKMQPIVNAHFYQNIACFYFQAILTLNREAQG
jgi:hypothetical protein